MKGNIALIIFRKERGFGTASFACYWHLKGHHQNLFSTLRYWYKNFVYYTVFVIALEHFNIVAHTCTPSVLMKTHFYETDNIFHFKT